MIRRIIKESQIQDLVLFRHGKAERPYDAVDDFSRNLIETGKKQSLEQAIKLRMLGFSPDVVLVSSAFRASQTWDVASEVFADADTIITRELYLASPELYLSKAAQTGAKSVMIIAHDPGLHALCRTFLKGANKDEKSDLLRLDLPTAGVAWFQKDANTKSTMRLVANLRP
jgi:phosphohistidine phosphatase